MEKLIIPETEDLPLIDFNPESGELLIKGNSFPNNSSLFYTRIIEWLQNYLMNVADETVLIIEIDYFNSGSQKYLFEIIKLMKSIELTGKKVKVKWFYYSDDEDLMMIGREYQLMNGLDFEFIEIH